MIMIISVDNDDDHVLVTLLQVGPVFHHLIMIMMVMIIMIILVDDDHDDTN